ncbi:MAG: SMC-Scp complex subunit ScpB [Proteobacteria bacterium]|nr:SMC-Scp complex subunit ScpB [Pseudomonadota bacterium]
MTENLKTIIESLVFVSEGPLSVDKIIKTLPEFDHDMIRQAISELKKDYESGKQSFCLQEVAGGLQFRTRSEYKEWISRLKQASPQKLSTAALETLAIIAYKQPIIRSEVEYIRGVDSGGVLRILLEKNLVKVLGRKEIPGRPLIYATTKYFLEVFGLKALKDLPTPKEIESFEQSAAEKYLPHPGKGIELPITGKMTPPNIEIPDELVSGSAERLPMEVIENQVSENFKTHDGRLSPEDDERPE